MIFVGVFVLAVLFETLYVRWTHAAVDGWAMRAAALSALIQVTGLVGIILATHEWRLVIPNALGHGVGSFMEVSRRAKALRDSDRGWFDQALEEEQAPYDLYIVEGGEVGGD